jgi:hypothetical protein
MKTMTQARFKQMFRDLGTFLIRMNLTDYNDKILEKYRNIEGTNENYLDYVARSYAAHMH